MTPTLSTKIKAVAAQLRADGPPLAKWARDVTAACIPTITNSAGMATARLGYAWRNGRPTWDVRHSQGKENTGTPTQAQMHKGEYIVGAGRRSHCAHSVAAGTVPPGYGRPSPLYWALRTAPPVHCYPPPL